MRSTGYCLWELSRLARQSPQVMAFLAEGMCGMPGNRNSPVRPSVKAWQEFLEAFGHRAVYEVEMANPRWREQPDYLFKVLATYASLPQPRAPSIPRAGPRASGR